MINLKEFIKSKDEIKTSNDGLINSDFGRALGSERLAVHWTTLPPMQRSSVPHSESHEEEFAFIVSGHPHLWVDGYLYQLEPGCAVGFKSGTGIAHSIINNTNENVEMIVLGERSKQENKYIYTLNPELKAEHNANWWDGAPQRSLGPHDGNVGNLSHQKKWQDLSFVANVNLHIHKADFSYPNDQETFADGLRLTNLVDLQVIGVSREILKPSKRSSWPHAHSLEEEFAVILKGHPLVWLNGFVHELNPGDCVFFKPGTGLAHVLINDTNQDVEYIGIGEAQENPFIEDLIFYPHHQNRNEEMKKIQKYFDVSQFGLQLGGHPGIAKTTCK
jgi:uncharacterized cupin superfamily protein